MLSDQDIQLVRDRVARMYGEDFAQHAMLRAVEHGMLAHPPGEVLKWCVTVARNRFRTVGKRLALREKLVDTLPESTGSDRRAPDAYAEARELLSRLDPKLVAWGMGDPEPMREGITPGSAKQKLSRLRKRGRGLQ